MPGDITRCQLCGTTALYILAYALNGVEVAPTVLCKKHIGDFWREVKPLRNEHVGYFDQRIRADHAGLSTPFSGELHVG